MRPLSGFVGRVLLPLAVVAAGAAGVTYYLWQRSEREQLAQVPAPVVSPIAAASPSAPPIRYPVPGEARPELTSGTKSPGPALDHGDPTFEGALAKLFGKALFDSLFNPNDIVRRIVVTVDNLTQRKQPSEDLLPIKPPDSEFVADGRGDWRKLSARGFKRYDPYIDLGRAVPSHDLVALYFRFYPLFQSAYRELGMRGYFNDRLVAVVDDLLSAPESTQPIHVVRAGPHYRFKFVDDQLETLPSGQKLLVRMGHDNEIIVKAKLRELRAELVSGAP